MVEVSFDIPFKRHVQLQMVAAPPEIFSEWCEIHGVKNVKGRERMDIALCHMWLPEHRQIVATALLEYYRRRPLSKWLRHIDSNWSWAYSTCFILEVFDLYKKRKGPPLRFDEDPDLAAGRLLNWLKHNNERPYVQDIRPYGQLVGANWPLRVYQLFHKFAPNWGKSFKANDLVKPLLEPSVELALDRLIEIQTKKAL